MHKLVLLRHGQSEWNLANRFTGWVDVDLTDTGRQQAESAGRTLLDQGFDFDRCYTSRLTRAIRTLWIVLDEMDRMWLPVERRWRLNERHYGALQSLNKGETAKKYGDEQVHIWRRSYSTPPPPVDENSEYHPSADIRYRDLRADEMPVGECLAQTVDRVMPVWNEEIAPAIKRGEKIIIAAHGNSLRALVKQLDGLSDEEIVGINIPTGMPLVYELDDNLNAVHREYLGDPEAVTKAMESVKNQGKSST